jgi:hypothetical protein
MGWTSQDDMINQLTVNGKIANVVYQKTTVAAGNAGFWQSLLNSAGTPPAATFGGAEATFVPTDDTWSEGAVPIGDITLPATKNLLSIGASVVAATGAPWFLLPIDLVGYAKLTTTNVSTNGTKVITMTPLGAGAGKGDRWPNGVGLRVCVASFATMGANAPTIQITYTDPVNGAGRVTTAGCVSTATATNGTILNSGNAANKYGPFLPLQGNDTGVKDIENLIWGGTAHASGSVAILLCKPLSMPIPVPATGLFSMVDLVNTIPSMRQLPNGVNLQFLLFGTGATTSGGTVYAFADYGWGG